MTYKKLKVDYKTPLQKQLDKLGIENHLDLEEITNLYQPSSDGYIYDVEDGKKMLGKSPEECEKIFKKQGRRALTIHEVLAIYRRNPNVLENHCIDITGSRYEDSDRVPRLYLLLGGPWLDWIYLVGASDEWGSASARIIGNKFEKGELWPHIYSGLEFRILELEKKMKKIEKVIRI